MDSHFSTLGQHPLGLYGHFPSKPLAVSGKVRNFAGENSKQEFGKWFLDVAKYVLTAMLLTAMIEGLSQAWLIAVSACVTLLCLLFGGILMHKGKEDEDRRERNRLKHQNRQKKGGK